MYDEHNRYQAKAAEEARARKGWTVEELARTMTISPEGVLRGYAPLRMLSHATGISEERLHSMAHL